MLSSNKEYVLEPPLNNSEIHNWFWPIIFSEPLWQVPIYGVVVAQTLVEIMIATNFYVSLPLCQFYETVTLIFWHFEAHQQQWDFMQRNRQTFWHLWPQLCCLTFIQLHELHPLLRNAHRSQPIRILIPQCSPTRLLLEVTFMAVGEPDYNVPRAVQATQSPRN